MRLPRRLPPIWGRIVHSLPVSRALLRAAALLVPRDDRAEWLSEWQSELWHVYEACQTPPHQAAEVTWFSLGAFRDALSLRRNAEPDTEPDMGPDAQPVPMRKLQTIPIPRPRSLRDRLPRKGTSRRCLGTLALCAAVSLVACLCLPGARRAMLPSPYSDADNLVILARGGYSAEHLPAVRLHEYRSWQRDVRHIFIGLAFYQPLLRRVRLAPHRTVTLSVARTTADLFDVLHLPLAARTGVVLSEEAWRRNFPGRAFLPGQSLRIAGEDISVVGVLPGSAWQLPGCIDAWQLEDARRFEALSPDAAGFVLARIRASAFPPPSQGQRYIVVPRSSGEDNDRYDCFSLAQRARLPLLIFLFTVLLACLALPATTPLPLGEYPAHRERLPARLRVRRWIFLAAKIALLMPIVFCASFSLAYGALPIDAPSAQYIQILTSFFGFLFAFRWVLQDQRRRCPVCLRRLTSPARVGQASRSFLAWNGTELICAVGHGLLHIPELPTSWFGTQRWFALDPSWSGLFADSYLSSARAS